MITRRAIRWALALPLIDGAIYANIRSKLVEAFGGAFEEVIIGGAPLNGEVEAFLHKIKFPFTVGYGMTECGPLISYTPGGNSSLAVAGVHCRIWNRKSSAMTLKPCQVRYVCAGRTG